MSRHSHAHAGEVVRSLGVAALPLFEQPAEPAPAIAPRPSEIRRAKVERLRDARWSRWIEAGKPVALAVARANGVVTAESFRAAAEKLPGVLPPAYGEDRTGSYVSSMFAEMVREGVLRKRTRSDGSVVTEYSSVNRNSHVIYELTGAA